MKLLLALLGLCLMSLGPAGARAEAGSQPLSLSLHRDGAQATRLPAYDPILPIAVTVTDHDAQPIDALFVVAAGPTGTSVKVPLVRSADGTFTGTLTLTVAGTWRLRLISRSGPLNVGTTPVTLEVAAPPPSNASRIGWAVGLGVFVVVGGSGFFILRRIVRPAAPAPVPALSERHQPAESEAGARPTAIA